MAGLPPGWARPVAPPVPEDPLEALLLRGMLEALPSVDGAARSLRRPPAGSRAVPHRASATALLRAPEGAALVWAEECEGGPCRLSVALFWDGTPWSPEGASVAEGEDGGIAGFLERAPRIAASAIREKMAGEVMSS